MDPTHRCSQCGNDLSAHERFCPRCAYPAGGSDEQQFQYRHRRRLWEGAIETLRRRVLRTVGLVYLLGFINLGAAYYLYEQGAIVEALATGIAGSVFTGCAIWAGRRPVLGLVVAFIFWLIAQFNDLLADDSLLWLRGAIAFIFIFVFVTGIRAAREQLEIIDGFEPPYFDGDG